MNSLSNAEELFRLKELTIQKVTSSAEEWISFLTFSANHYKYPVTDQLLFYAQNPNAIAVATFEQWHSIFNRKIKSGSKAFRLLNDDTSKGYTACHFDISDTYGSSNDLLWKVPNDVKIDLLKQCGVMYHDNSFALADFISKQLEDNFLEYCIEIDPRNEYDIDEELLATFLVQAVSIIVGTRVQIDTEKEKYLLHNNDYLKEMFKCGIAEEIFDTIATISKQHIKTIERAVKQYDREQQNFNRNTTTDQGGERDNLLSNLSSRRDTDLRYVRGESIADRGIISSQSQILREVSNLPRESVSQPVGEVQENEETELHTNGNRQGMLGEGSNDVQSNITEQYPSGGLPRESRTSGESSLTNYRDSNHRDVGEVGSEEIIPSNETADKAVFFNGEIGSSQTSLFGYEPSIDEIREKYVFVDLMPPYSNGKERIYKYITDGHSKSEIVAFLKDEYGTGGRSASEYGVKNIWYTAKRFEVTIRDIGTESIKIQYSWSQVADKIISYVRDGVYYTPDVIESDFPSSSIKIEKNEERLANWFKDFFNSLPTKYKGTFEIDTLELEKWDHISSKDKNLTITLTSKLADDYGENCFTQFNTDKSDEATMNNAIYNSPFLSSLRPDSDFSISLTPHRIFIFYHSFPRKHIDFSLAEEFTKESQTEELENISIQSLVSEDTSTPTIEKDIDITYKVEYETPSTIKGRFNVNVEAIKTLRVLEAEDRAATIEEREVLSKYCGWGGSSQVFDANNSTYQKEYAELKLLLSEDDYTAARASTLSSFYTKPFIIKEIYSMINRFGFSGGKVLDPSMGIGAFYEYMPEAMARNSTLSGIELDSITGRIGAKLFPKADIEIKGFEAVEIPDNSYDLVISNIPFGGYKVSDNKYSDKLLIHDYFFQKALDKVRPGGIVVFITSKGVLDKQDSESRILISKRSNLVGAVRLPTSAFNDTDVTTDIIILQKREQELEVPQPWVYTSQTENGIPINSYYLEHPEHLLGEMVFDSSMYGSDTQTALHPYKDKDLKELLRNALDTINCSYTKRVVSLSKELREEVIPADSKVRNYTNTLVNDEVYYRENSIMALKTFRSDKAKERTVGQIHIKTALLELLEGQRLGCSDDELLVLQQSLNSTYDSFVKKHGYLSDSANVALFTTDMDASLLHSLEIKDKEGKIVKADIFSKRTIRTPKPSEVSSGVDALALSINYRGKVDLPYMEQIYTKPTEEIIKELEGEIYRDPTHYDAANITVGWETKAAYLSGDVRKKLTLAKLSENQYPGIFSSNVIALTESQPEDIQPSDISVRLGSTWVDIKYINQFVYELLDTPIYLQEKPYGRDDFIAAKYNQISGEWSIQNKSKHSSAKVNQIFGTKRISGYQIIEDTLNLKTVTIKDRVEDGESVKYVYNHKESTLAREKQNKIKTTYREWIFNDTERREYLVRKYNDTYNNLRLREYDGSRLDFPGMNPDIKLYDHQRNAIARIREGNNTLLAHVVGAGKSFTMICGAKEQLRLGIATKVAFVVPNHLIDQMTSDIYTLFPNSKVLKSSKKDFEKKNRQQFLSRIAFSDVEIIVMGHTQFERIMMSDEYREKQIHKDINEIINAIDTLKSERGASYTVKQLEKMKANMETELKFLTDTSKKDHHITFEQLGINSLFVDEAHYYKNGAIFSKMTNVAGISASRSKKASDMLMKCRYIEEVGGSITFATGTPISNTMCETYIMQRYLQQDMLLEKGIRHFDEWASDFGETKTTLELTPEGNGFRSKTRFSSFYNLPELMQMFKTVADIKTADVLDLPTPKLSTGKPIIVVSKPSLELELFMKDSINRVNLIRERIVKPHEDNMLKFTGDAKKAGLDMRLIDPYAENDPNGKISKCASNILMHYKETDSVKGVQIVFCDTSTPSTKNWNVYSELKTQLIYLGILEDEIAFVHQANTEKEKEQLFSRCRSGDVRVLIGSTAKCGAGTNIQRKLVALHHLDCPFRPSDIEQREGRILRQGNSFDEVFVYRYVTERSFDAYLWSIVANKAKFIAQIMNSNTAVSRTCEDIDEAILNYAEVQAIASGNPLIKEKIEIDNEVSRLQMLKSSYINERFTLQTNRDKEYPKLIAQCNSLLEKLDNDICIRTEKLLGEQFKISINDVIFTSRESAGDMIHGQFAKVKPGDKPIYIASYRGFRLEVSKESFSGLPYVVINGNSEYKVEVNLALSSGIITRIDNQIDRLEESVEIEKAKLANYISSLEATTKQLMKPFEYEALLDKALNRQTELSILLDAGSVSEDDLEEEPPINKPKEQGSEYDLDDEDEEDLEL